MRSRSGPKWLSLNQRAWSSGWSGCRAVARAHKRARIQQNVATIEEFIRVAPVQPLASDVAHHYGRIRTELERLGTPVGAFDLLIAAHALALDVILVTNNTREFRRIDGLQIENWAE